MQLGCRVVARIKPALFELFTRPDATNATNVAGVQPGCGESYNKEYFFSFGVQLGCRVVARIKPTLFEVFTRPNATNATKVAGVQPHCGEYHMKHHFFRSGYN